MLSLFLVLLLMACMVSVTGPQRALLSILAIGFLQDPFRKLIPGEPIFFIVTVGVVFACVFASTLQRNGFVALKTPLVGWSDILRQPLSLFVLIILIQFLHSMLRYGSPIISFIGFLSYTAPLFAIVVGYHLVERVNDVRRFMKIYVSIGVVLACTVVMSFSGIELQIFREVGKGLVIYDQGTVLRSFSGFMRTGEIAAWHMGTSCCFLIILFFSSQRKMSMILVIGLLLLMMGAIAFTGRRKMLMFVTLFGFAYGLGFSYYRRQFSATYIITAALVIFAAWVLVEIIVPGGYGDSVNNYIARGTSVYSSATDRAVELGLQPINWAINRVGWFGGGLGIASQGSHLFNVSSIAGGSGEGGLGKIVVELGVPGLIAIAWLMASFARYISLSLKLSAQPFVPRHMLALMLGIANVLLVNVLTFSVATQLYGDMFVLIMIGLLAGFLFALPKLVVRGIQDEQSVSASFNGRDPHSQSGFQLN